MLGLDESESGEISDDVAVFAADMGLEGLAAEEAIAGLIGADRMCISTDYPHFDSNFPNVANNLLGILTRRMRDANTRIKDLQRRLGEHVPDDDELFIDDPTEVGRTDGGG